MPREDRDRNPRSYAPACASAVTAGVLCCCALLAGLMFLFVCAISGNAAEEPVFAPKTGHIYERRLIEKQIDAEGKCPVTKEEITKDDLMEIKTNKSVRPRPATATSIPGMLTLLQSEWVIARLIRERDMARSDNQKLQEQLSHSTPLPGGAIREDAETGLTPEILQKMKELSDTLTKEMHVLRSKTRKRKDFPDLNPLAQLKKFTCARVGSHPIHKSTAPGITCVDVHRSDAKRVVTGGMDAQVWRSEFGLMPKFGSVIVFDAEKEKMQEKLLGHAKKDVVLSASQDATVKVSDISIHPLGDYFLSAGLDKSWDSRQHLKGVCYNCMKWHPDGMILASGTQVKVMIRDSKKNMGGPVQIWDIKVKLWDLRKPLNIQTLQLSAPVNSVAFDSTGQYLSVASDVVQIYNWASKSSMAEAVTLKDRKEVLSLATMVQLCSASAASVHFELSSKYCRDRGFSQHAMSLASVFALCGPFDLDNMDKMDSCPGLEKWINSTHMDHHHHWHSKWMSHNHMDHHHHWHPHWLRGSFHHESPPPTVSSPVFFDKAVEEDVVGRPIPMGQHSIEEAAAMVAAGAAPKSDRDEASPAVEAVATAAAAPAMPAMWF
ncbi:Pre-mRNA-processing factor 19-like 2 [Symbiodinium microadriaticum]|uniref:Pre-mRNA-processing factor 19 n=1 Tax=Symbiodinium microadriaticum TaxID=2951 RepID=A0A1Q9CJK3_SYMMI|nr:Pre-mRNA-processing factor 19-like 2 [Symbiodinium microadriaticum]